ncbi:MAG: AbrB/MazE/SpoVT family DNA-binding domain-containing protein [Gammaproteobacteria bacterium]|nr:AbrB/MazE/SpoVT family DNA-binding domain-containing protein [Gammaproteobacteria bacterium]
MPAVPANPQPDQTTTQRVRIDAAGRIVIPAEMRRSLGIRDGQDLTVSLEKDGITLRTLALARARVRAIARAHRKGQESVVDEFIAERRAEAAHE